MLFYIIPTILLHSDSRSCPTAIMSTYRDCWSAHHIMHIASRHITKKEITSERNTNHNKSNGNTHHIKQTNKINITLDHITSHCNKLNRNKHYITITKTPITSHCIISNHTDTNSTLHQTEKQTTLQYMTMHHSKSHCIAACHMTSHCITLHHIAHITPHPLDLS